MHYAGFSYLVYECKAHVKERGERNNDLPIHDEREPSMSISLFFSCFYSADNFDVGRDSSIARGLCLNTRCGLSIYAVCFSPLPRSSSSSKKSAFVHLSYVVHTASYDQCVFATTREQRSNEVCAVIKPSWISNSPFPTVHKHNLLFVRLGAKLAQCPTETKHSQRGREKNISPPPIPLAPLILSARLLLLSRHFFCKVRNSPTVLNI